MSLILYIYLAGWAGTSTYGIITECKKPVGPISPKECMVMHSILGVAWPVTVPAMIYEKIKDKK